MGRRGSIGWSRRRRARRFTALGAALALGASLISTVAAVPAPAAAAPAATAPINILVFRGAAAEQRDPVVRATDAITSLASANGIGVTASSDPAVFNPADLAKYRGVVYLSAQGIALTPAQEAALQSYMKSGGGFLGISDASRAQENSTWFTGLIGARPVGARLVAEVTASGENLPNEGKDKLIDGDPSTKWLAFNPTAWVTYKLAAPFAVSSYSMTSANDFAGRDPKNWTIQGSNDNSTWTDLDTRVDEDFPQRFQKREFTFTNTTEYLYYRLNITANSGEPLVQLADWDLVADKSELPPPPEPAVQEATIDVLDRNHPANEGLGMTWKRTDRFLNWEQNPVGQVHTIAQVRENTYNPGTGANGAFHPISWCRDYDGGRSFYTAMGRTEASYGEEGFRNHLLGALKWTTGMVRADCKATIASNYKIEKLNANNAPGQLDQMGEPHGLTIAPDGKVFYIGRGACAGNVVPQPNDWTNPDIGKGCGTIHVWDPATKKAKLATTLVVMGNRGSGGELVKNEEGLVGITLDPNFTDNGWIYVYWMPHESIDRDNRIGKRTISRFTFNKATGTIDQATRKDLLSWDAQIHSCCHVGGGMAFDKDGNLFVSTGDNNSSQGSNGYSGNNWTAEYKGVSFQDARRTSGNTNNLNGKILRIHPEADGTYTIPEGNLFPPGTEKTLPEIYVMGVRNPARIQVDPEHNWLTAAWVGPDASSPSPELGPAKYETATIITEPGNHGWPYCMGNKQPYRDRSSTDAAVLTGWYDCDNPVNTSPRNTGLVNLPPVKKNMIWYSPDGGGPVFPNRPNSNIPTYVAEDATYTQPYLRGGGQAVMSGPTYHYDRVNTNSGVAWPEYWDDKWFIGDQSNAQNRIAVTVDPAGVPTAEPPVFAETLRQIIPPGGGDNKLQSWMDAKFGPDGALYMLDYGSGFFTIASNQKLIKISYIGGEATPTPAASNVAVQNRALTHQFYGAKSGGVSWKWEFGDGTISTEANPKHTYTRTGPFTAKLTTTYADGEVVVSRTAVNVGCSVSEPTDTVLFGPGEDAVDTRVKNKNAGGGCKIDDMIDDEITWSSHAGFVNHVTVVAKNLEQLGIINPKDQDRLVKAARTSVIGDPGQYGYDAIFDGTQASFQNWAMAPSGEFSIQPDGSLRPSGGLGMLWYAKNPYRDFSVKLQFRDIAPDGYRANSGVFVRFPDPRTPLDQRPAGSCGTVGAARTSQAWVAIYCGHEIQIYDGESGEPQKTGSIYNFDQNTLANAGATPKGQWNDYEIRVVGQHYTIIRNGVVINEFENAPGQESSRNGDPSTTLRQFAEGYIGLQNHSNNDLIEFRNVRVRPL